jgi:methionine-rich copper-binding protein CopC
MPADPVFRLARAVVFAAVCVLVTASPAEAHTSLTKAVPGQDSRVPSPARVELTFADPVRFTGVVVLDAKQGHHESGRPQAVDNRVTQRIAGVLAPGVYTVGWRVVAPDGHPVTGEYRFTVTGAPATGPKPSAASATAQPSAPVSTSPASPAAQPAARTSSAGWWWVGLGLLLVAAAAGGVALVRRHRRA